MKRCTGPEYRLPAGRTGSRAPGWRAFTDDLLAVLNEAIGFIAANPDEHGAPYIVDAYDGRMRLSRKRGAPCPACTGPIRSRKLGGRTAYYCRPVPALRTVRTTACLHTLAATDTPRIGHPHGL